MEHEKPVTVIEDIEFMVDIEGLRLEEKANPYNKILFSEMKETESGYEFEFCWEDRNIPLYFETEDSVIVKLPPLKELDPGGMARKYNVSLQELKSKTDFEIIVDQAAYHRRVAMGMLPTLEIYGHTFYVDIRMDKLRPKDDFLSKGIIFSEVGAYYDEGREKYLVPYNPKTHEFQAPDYNTITEYPKDLIAIEFPSEQYLDPVGWNRHYGLDQKSGLKWIGVKDHHTAQVIPWKHTPLLETVEENLREKQQKEAKEEQLSHKPKGKGLKP